MTTIYIDVLVCLNLMVNYFLLLATAKFLSLPFKTWRLLLGALLGGGYSLYILLPELAAWFSICVEIAMAVTITLTAFGKRAFLKTCACFFAMSFLFAGTMFLIYQLLAPKNLLMNNGVVYFQISPIIMIVATVVSYVLIRLFQRITGRAVPKELFSSVEVIHNGTQVTLRAKIDTGNQLREPFSHLPVIVAKESLVSPLLPEGVLQPGLRMIPFHSLDQEGVLPGFQPDKIVVEYGGAKTETAAYLGICKSEQLPGDFDALMNPDLILTTGSKGKQHETVQRDLQNTETKDL